MIVITAVYCRPPGSAGFRAGEYLLGWEIINQVSRFDSTLVIAREQDRSDIEWALKQEYLENIEFYYVNLQKILHPMLKFQIAHQLYLYLWQIRAFFKARTVLKNYTIDLFHFTTPANDWMASHIGALLPVPYIRGPGGGAQRTPRRFRSEYSLKARLLENARSMGQWLYRHDPFFILSQHRAKAILVCCKESMDKIPEKWKHKAQLFPVNGISSEDLAFINMIKPEHGNGKFRIVSTGKLIQLKGFPLAIRAFKILADKHEDAEFHIIGEGSERPRIESLITKLELEGKVYLRGWMKHEDVLSEMASCDVFLFASMRDGGGQVVIEAMAAGKPVVCLDLGGPGIHVTDECGIKVPAETPEQAVRDMAAALERLYLDEELRKKMGEAARKRVEEHYHWDRLGERLMKIYEQAVSEAKSN